MNRADRARLIAAHLARQIGRVAPRGLGHWPAAWRIVAEPSRQFLDALAGWEATGAAEDQRRVQDAGAAVVDAWRRAAWAWERAGRPGLAKIEPGSSGTAAAQPAGGAVLLCLDGCGRSVGRPGATCAVSEYGGTGAEAPSG